jgi:hypothetical protein
MVAPDFSAREETDQGRRADGLSRHAEFRMAFVEMGFHRFGRSHHKPMNTRHLTQIFSIGKPATSSRSFCIVLLDIFQPVTSQEIVRMRGFTHSTAAYLRSILGKIIEYAAIAITPQAAGTPSIAEVNSMKRLGFRQPCDAISLAKGKGHFGSPASTHVMRSDYQIRCSKRIEIIKLNARLSHWNL